jgi:very-short-patch-repair endonuclease
MSERQDNPLSLTEGEGGARSASGEGAKRKIKLARVLRKNLTAAEHKLWYLLRDRRFEGYKFRRQYPVGPYIADFACTKYGLIVELDGSQHADQMEYDRARDQYLQQQGYRVIRIWNNEIFKNTEGVMLHILNILQHTLTPALSLSEGEGAEEFAA